MDFLAFLKPIEWVVAWILYLFHQGLTKIGLAPTSGLAWVLAIVGLVIVMRILLIPLFVKQIKASRGMQLIAPEMQAIQKKYKGKTDPASREAMSRETMALYRKHGTSPFSSCLPILAQSPIFFALFRVLNALRPIAEGTYRGGEGIGPINQAVAQQAEGSSIFGAQLSDTFLHTPGWGPEKWVTILLIGTMTATTFFTQRQLTMKNMPESALQGPMARQQRMLMYLMPLLFAFSGVNFPIGVLIYWTTTNLWSMGQQYWVITNNPTPGSQAYRDREEKLRRKYPERYIEETPSLDAPRGQRQQPKRQPRAKRSQTPPPGTGAEDATEPATEKENPEEGPEDPSAAGTDGEAGPDKPKPAGPAQPKPPKQTPPGPAKAPDALKKNRPRKKRRRR